MKILIAAGMATVLALSHAAAAETGLDRLAQAGEGAAGGSAPSGTSPPAVTMPRLNDEQPAPSSAPSPQAAPAAAPAPAKQAVAPQTVPPPPTFTGTQRNNPVTAPSALTTGTGPLPYGGTQTTVGVPRPVPTQPYGGTQRDSVGSVYGDLNAHGGTPTYTGTQGTLGAPQDLGNAGQPSGTDNTRLYGAQPYGAQPYGTAAIGGTQRNSAQSAGTPGASLAYTGNAPGNGTVYSRAPLGSLPYTRDQTGVYGGVGSYDARGVYTGVAPQPFAYGQVYATNRGIRGGIVGTGVDATGPLRPFIPPINGPGRTNSGYGVPNGSKPTTMDARGIQRAY